MDYGSDENGHSGQLDGLSMPPLESSGNLNVWNLCKLPNFKDNSTIPIDFISLHSLCEHFEVSLAVISVNVNAGANRINKGADKAV